MDAVKTDEMKKEADAFLEEFNNFLSKIPNIREKANILLFETIHHYAAATSLFMESGLFDKVIFTEYDKGALRHPAEISDLYDKTFFTGGGYNARCYYRTTKAIVNMLLKHHDSTKGRLYAIRDLVLNPPNPNKGEKAAFTTLINPRYITNGTINNQMRKDFFPQEEILSLDEAIDKIMNS